MQRLANIKHYKICRIDNIIYGTLSDRFKILAQPLRRRTDFYALDVSRDIPGAKSGRHRYRNRAGLLRKDRLLRKRIVREWNIENCRELLRDPAVRETIMPAIRGDLYIKNIIFDVFD